MLKIRKAIPSDATMLADILCCAWHTAFSDILTKETLTKNINIQNRTTMFKKILTDDNFHTLIAFWDEVPCGLCSYAKSRDNDFEGVGEIIAIHLKPEFWGKGISKPILNAAIAELRHLGYAKITLWTFEANARARKFYEKNGFAFDGTLKDSGLDNAKEIRYRLEDDK